MVIAWAACEDVMPKRKRVRVKLDLSPDAYDRLKKMTERAGTLNNGRTVGRALFLYEWYIERLQEGSKFQICKDGVARDLELQF